MNRETLKFGAFFLLCLFCFTGLHSQEKNQGLRAINKKNYNSWYLGAGFQNVLVHGDLRNFGVNGRGTFSYGAYVYGGKMFNSILGTEVKIGYSDIGGAPQQWSNTYDVRYTTIPLNDVYFEGKTLNIKLLGVVNLSNIAPTGRNKQRKWNLAFYTGIGYHQYTSALYDIATNTKIDDANFEENGLRGDWASSWFYPAELGIKYRLNRRLDFELRSSINLNVEDHLDAAISDKADYEIFFETNLGIVYKLGSKRKHIKWINPFDEAIIGAGKGTKEIKLEDTDGDGVIDQMDKDNYTPEGVKVYGDGTSIDSDKDGVPDYKDKCPFKKGLPYLDGCPPAKDTDKDGVFDDVDDCPTIYGSKNNNGCPEIPNSVLRELNYIAKNIYFETGKNIIKPRSFSDLNKIADILKEFPNVHFFIDGHTDNVGNDTYNMSLSRRRAMAVKEYLESNGVDGRQLEARGFGESRPKTSNSSEGGRQLNRRVEINLKNSRGK